MTVHRSGKNMVKTEGEKLVVSLNNFIERISPKLLGNAKLEGGRIVITTKTAVSQ